MEPIHLNPASGSPAGLIGLSALMRRTAGATNVRVGLIDGPVSPRCGAIDPQQVRYAGAGAPTSCRADTCPACRHGTSVASVMFASRSSAHPGICPQCTLFSRPIFGAACGQQSDRPSATTEELGAAILDCLRAGANVINISAAMRPSERQAGALRDAIDAAAMRGVIVVTAAGNDGQLGGTALTRHPWVVPVVPCDGKGRALGYTNCGASIGRQGLMAPGLAIPSYGVDGTPVLSSGSSIAAPFVSGAVALLMSVVGRSRSVDIRAAMRSSGLPPGRSVIPPLLDIDAALRSLGVPGVRRA